MPGRLIGDAEAIVGAATGTSWVRVALKLAPWLLIAGLGAGLEGTRARLHEVRLEDRAAVAEGKQASAEQLAANTQRLANAVSAYADRTAALKPLVITSHDTVEHYAETPAGRVLCRAADRVRDIDALDTAIAHPGAASGGAGAVSPDTAATPAGR